jgi:hypothetical protein
MGLAFDAAVATDEFSLVGRRVEINRIPFVGVTNVTGGGVTIEAKTYVRGADGRILYVSAGIETPQDVTLEMTPGTWKVLRTQLVSLATTLGFSGAMAYRFAPMTIVHQWISGNPLAQPYTETMVVKVAGRVPEMPNTGETGKVTITCKQEQIPQET